MFYDYLSCCDSRFDNYTFYCTQYFGKIGKVIRTSKVRNYSLKTCYTQGWFPKIYEVKNNFYVVFLYDSMVINLQAKLIVITPLQIKFGLFWNQHIRMSVCLYG